MIQIPLTPDYKREDDFFGGVFDAIPQAVMVVDEKRRVHSINSFLSRALGLTLREVAGKRSGEVLGCAHAFYDQAVRLISESCTRCQLKPLVASVFETDVILHRMVPLQISFDEEVHELELQIHARQFRWGGRRFAIFYMGDMAEWTSLKRAQNRNISVSTLHHNLMIGNHPSMLQVYRFINEVAPYPIPVLIQGETGTGKELVALALHQASQRAKERFVPVHCAALPEGLLESELFGHVKGAFTGATEDRKGRFQLADGGSLFLDKIGELSPSLQVKLLRVIQEQRFERLGSSQTLHMDFRVISATNKNLAAEVESGRFRADLFYRLCAAVITVPPLRERRSDIPLLANFFLDRWVKGTERAKPVLSANAETALMEHDWPGNVRELENNIRFAILKANQGVILPGFFPFAHGSKQAHPVGKQRRKRKLEMDIVNEALQKVDGNKVKAAKLLKVSRSTLYRFMDEMEIAEN